MDSHESIQLEIEQPERTGTNTIGRWLRRIFTLDELPYEKHYRPVFSLGMTVVHVSIYLTIFIGVCLYEPHFDRRFIDLGMLFVPCMKPTAPDVRLNEVSCTPWDDNHTCYYNDILRSKCSSFLYPHQLWRMLTVNLLHLNGLHLFFNMLKQLLYGIALERKYGSTRVTLVYWLSDAGASLMAMTIEPHVSGIGASGALYGLMVFFVVERFIAMKRQTGRRLSILAQLGILVVAPMIITASLANSLRYSIGHTAHVGGALVGFLLAIGMLTWQGYTLCRCIAFATLAIYFALTLAIFFLTDAPFVDEISLGP